MTREQIEMLQTQLEDCLGGSVNPDDSYAIRNKLENLSTLLATCAACCVESKKILQKIRSAWLRKHVENIKDLSPSVVKEYLATCAIDEEALFYRCEKNYSALVHGIDALRSILSFLKSEISNING